MIMVRMHANAIWLFSRFQLSYAAFCLKLGVFAKHSET